MLFGFVSSDNGGGDIPVEYGMPSAKYRVKGKVIDADTQEPVPGIEVVTGAVHTGDGKEWLSYPDTLITDKDGAFATERTEFPSKKYRFIVSLCKNDMDNAQPPGALCPPLTYAISRFFMR